MNYDYTKQAQNPLEGHRVYSKPEKSQNTTGFCAYKAHTVCYMCILSFVLVRCTQKQELCKCLMKFHSKQKLFKLFRS